jgi:hypothetical protein
MISENSLGEVPTRQYVVTAAAVLIGTMCMRPALADDDAVAVKQATGGESVNSWRVPFFGELTDNGTSRCYISRDRPNQKIQPTAGQIYG